MVMNESVIWITTPMQWSQFQEPYASERKADCLYRNVIPIMDFRDI